MSHSEVAHLRQKIALECQASWWALHAFNAGTAQHAFIGARFRAMETYHHRLSELVGEEQATDHLCEVYNHTTTQCSPCPEQQQSATNQEGE
jgi:hypothetical protein